MMLIISPDLLTMLVLTKCILPHSFMPAWFSHLPPKERMLQNPAQVNTHIFKAVTEIFCNVVITIPSPITAEAQNVPQSLKIVLGCF